MIKTCRGEKCREKIVQDYNIIPRSHTKLLQGQVMRSCTGDLLTDSYYSFEYVNKVNKKDTGGFLCGSYAAKHFLSLINHPGLKLFDPLTQIGGGGSTSQSIGNTGMQTQWHPLSRELYNAINLIVVCWNKPIYGRLAKIKDWLEKVPNNEPYDDQIQFVNKVVGKDHKNRTLSFMLSDLRKQNPSLRHYSFEQVNAVLAKLNIKSNFS
ncbi:hypothetical protein [Pseudobacillus badius]|uniref:hypothetical protein n=1 Tax=Bacillus badius TaxID=1455 RepID=UPI003D32AF29